MELLAMSLAEKQGNVVILGGGLGFFWKYPDQSLSPDLTAWSVWSFVYFSCNVIRILQLKRLHMSMALQYLSSQHL